MVSVEISSWADLASMTTDASYILVSNLNSSSIGYDTYASATANGGKGWLPINGYKITLDGNNNTISGIVINDATLTRDGFFNNISLTTLKNIGFLDIDCFIGYGSFLGGIAYSTSLSNIYITGQIERDTAFATGLLLEAATDNSSIINCYGAVSSVGIGSFIAWEQANYSPTITSCFFDIDLMRAGQTSLGTKKTTAEMQMQSTFVGWDFDTIWQINPSEYPTLIPTLIPSLIEYIPPLQNAVNFELSEYTAPLTNALDFALIGITASTSQISKVKIAGTFSSYLVMVKIGGTFVEKIMKIRVGGVFQ